MNYSDQVMDHFMNPRNMGEMENPDGVGKAGNPVCGDTALIYLKIDNDVITDIKFKTFGCAAAIATTSMMTEMVKGKSIEQAMKISDRDILDALGGLPSPKEHCSLIATEGIHKAIQNYRNSKAAES